MRRSSFFLLIALPLCGAVLDDAPAPDWNQPYRPQYHFSPYKNWTNDPNGLVFFEGEYHLFFQFNPSGDLWGHMSWGHAVSSDLLHWKELPVALPEEKGVMIFTGSTVIDRTNSSGFCQGGKPCMVAVYTGYTPQAGSKKSLQTQNVAYSNDRGRTWTKYPGNPVLNLNLTDFRDPKVFWSDESKRWIMAVSMPDDHKVRLYGSPDLKAWKQISEFGPAGATGGQWECPELFELPVSGRGKQTRWVMKVGLNPGARAGGSGEQYFIGKFDGTRFTNENPSTLTLWTDYGKDCYCALTFNNLPRDQKKVMIGWMDNWQYAAKLPTTPWRGQMTYPRALSLRETKEGIRLFQDPIDPKVLATNSRSIEANHGVELNTRSYVLESQVAAHKQVTWKVFSDSSHYTSIDLDVDGQTISLDRSKSGLTDFSADFPGKIDAPLSPSDKPMQVKILVDRSSIEVFADSGRVVSTNLVFPEPGANGIEVIAKDGGVQTTLTEIKSIH